MDSLVGAEGINLLINNAGILVQSPLLETSSEDMLNVFNTNVLGPMNMIKVSIAAAEPVKRNTVFPSRLKDGLTFLHLQEFVPHLRAAAKASKMPGMSTMKAAVICMSSYLGSVEGTKDSYTYFSSVSYRVSKVSGDRLSL